jgi:hypothetical protein
MLVMWEVVFERLKSVQILTISPWDSNPGPTHHFPLGLEPRPYTKQ